jgi:hypothetical protein
VVWLRLRLIGTISAYCMLAALCCADLAHRHDGCADLTSRMRGRGGISCVRRSAVETDSCWLAGTQQQRVSDERSVSLCSGHSVTCAGSRKRP